MADGRSRLRPCFADLDALVPRVVELGVHSTSAVSKPRTTATATTHFPGFGNDVAFGAYGTDCHLRGCWCMCICEYWSKHKDENMKTVTVGSIYMAITLDLHLQAFTPSGQL